MKEEQQAVPVESGQSEELKSEGFRETSRPPNPYLTGRDWRKGKFKPGGYGSSTGNRKQTKSRKQQSPQRIAVKAVVMENGKPKVGLDGKPVYAFTGEIRTIQHHK